jgi:CRP-like cAMP-binding protein
MKYTQLLSFLNNDKQFDSDEIEKVRKYFTYAIANKKEIILDSETVCDKIFFINKGIVRAYYTNEKGNVITRMIVSENQFITNMISFRNFGKNIETFECLENTEYLFISRNELTNLLDCCPSLRIRYCEILEQYNAIQINHIHFITNSDVCAKIHYIKSNFPNLITRANDHILASFLGLSRETIVRHKSNLL